MSRAKNIKRNSWLVLVLTLGFFCVGILSCGGNGESSSNAESGSESGISSSQKADLESTKGKPAKSSKKSSTPSDWKTYSFQGWSLSFPGNWNGDEEAGVWWPGEGSLDMGRPALSVHCGGIPLMPNTKFEDRVLSHINSEPVEKQDLSVSGFSGFKCSWEFMGNKHIGLFLEEKVGGGMSVIHFLDCQAPSGDYDQYEGDFEKILTYFSK
ncbi:MAG: hypothetical protein GY705_31845 [Bacteroidetes bacterium]|nr:hypothetical protein [Bacteroidota bacterium]